MRGRTAPEDITTYIKRLEARIKNLETNQRIGYTSFEVGHIKMISEFPEIDMYPIGYDSGRQVSFYAFDNGGLGEPAGTAVTLLVETYDAVSGEYDSAGGKIFLGNNFAILSLNNHAEGYPEAYIWLGQPTAESIDIQGMFTNQNQTTERQAIYTGSFDTGAGFSSFTHTYFQSFASLIIPIVGLLNSAGSLTWNLTAQSASSFTVAWSGLLTKTINFWNVRT